MELIKPSSENEMIAEFLKAELYSERFGDDILKILKKYNIDRNIIENPDPSSDKENEMRKKALGYHRGYGENRDYFRNFPENIRWEEAHLSPDDLKKVKYIDYRYWNKISGGSRLIQDAVNNIKAGIEVFKESNQRFFNVLQAISQGKKFPKIILVSTHKSGDLVILEGHVRLTAYLMKPRLLPKKLEAIIGYSPDFDKWDLY